MKDSGLLIISHNVMDRENNVGKTIDSITERIPINEKYQLYFSKENPNSMLCNEYLRISDLDIINTILKKNKAGKIIKSIEKNTTTKSSNNFINKIYRLGNKRIPLLSMLRDKIWKLVSLKKTYIPEWINSFNPKVIFFIPSDYEFSYRLILK